MMKLKVFNKSESLTTIIQIADIEYTANEKCFRVWDITGDTAEIICPTIAAAENCVRDLWRADRAELLDAEINWDFGDEMTQ